MFGRPIRSPYAYFYPRPPRGGRQSPAPANFFRISLFLSTPSARRATFDGPTIYREEPISIHALREEGDCCGLLCFLHHNRFLSTPSARRATSLHSHPFR